MTLPILLFSKVTVLVIALIVFVLAQVLVILLLSFYILSSRLSRFGNQASPLANEKQITNDAVKFISAELPGSRWFGENAALFEHRFLQSYDGLKLHAWFYRQAEAKNLAIICHGYTDYLGSISLYTQYFINRKWNVLMIDQRSHGFSEGKYIGMSVSESQDLLNWTELMKVEFPQLENIVWLGWSMGAATVLQISDKQLEKVRAIVADSGFSSVKGASLHSFPSAFEKGVVKLFLPFVNFIVKLRTGVDLNRGNAIEHVKQTKYPILFFHGDQDSRVPLDMTEAMYEASPAPKTLVIAEGSAHVRGFSEHPQLFTNALDEFLTANNL